MLSTITSGLRGFFAAPDLAIDLGTANTRLYANGHGLIADEPSVIKLQPGTGTVEAVGARAARLAKLDPYSPAVSPLHAGVVADVDAATSLLTPFLKRAQRFGLRKPRALACAPTDACEEERAALVEATRRAGASAVVVVPEPLAAAASEPTADEPAEEGTVAVPAVAEQPAEPAPSAADPWSQGRARKDLHRFRKPQSGRPGPRDGTADGPDVPGKDDGHG